MTFRRGWRTAGVTGAAFAALTALPLLRQAGAPAWDTVWAEDGAEYLQAAEDGTGAATLLRGYAGYLQLVPRLLPLPTELVPLRWEARLLAASAAAVGGLAALAVYRFTAGWIAQRPLRAVVAASVSLAPVLGAENTATIAYLMWILVAAGVWAGLAPAPTRADVALRAIVVIAAVTSNPVGIVVCLPVVVGVALARRFVPAERWVLAAGAGAALLQVFVIVVSDDETPSYESRARDLFPLYGVRVMGSALTGERPLPGLWDAFGDGLPWLGILVGVAVVGVLAAGAEPGARRLGLGLVAGTVPAFLVPVWTRGTEPIAIVEGLWNPGGVRYVVVAVLLFGWGLVVLAAGQRSAARRRWLPRIALAHALVITAVSFRVTTTRSDGPRWSTEVDQAEARCGRTGSGVVEVFTAPEPPWHVEVTCARARS